MIFNTQLTSQEFRRLENWWRRIDPTIPVTTDSWLGVSLNSILDVRRYEDYVSYEIDHQLRLDFLEA